MKIKFFKDHPFFREKLSQVEERANKILGAADKLILNWSKSHGHEITENERKYLMSMVNTEIKSIYRGFKKKYNNNKYVPH